MDIEGIEDTKLGEDLKRKKFIVLLNYISRDKIMTWIEKGNIGQAMVGTIVT